MRGLLVAVVLLFPLGAQAEELGVPFHRQNTLVWCWAATIAMVGDYVTDRSAEDCEVLSAYDRALGGPGLCCEAPMQCLRPGQTTEMTAIMGNLYGMSGYHHVRPLTYAEIMEEIDSDHPMIAALSTGFSGHVVVITGYEPPDRVILLDPMSGRHNVPYQQLLSNAQLGNWTETLTVDTARDCRMEYVNETYMDYEMQMRSQQIPCQHCGCTPFGCGCMHQFDVVTAPVQVPVQRVRSVPTQICD